MFSPMGFLVFFFVCLFNLKALLEEADQRVDVYFHSLSDCNSPPVAVELGARNSTHVSHVTTALLEPSLLEIGAGC